MSPIAGSPRSARAVLAELVALGGASRLLDTALARCDYRDLPERWSDEPAVAERLLARLMWLAYVDLDVALARVPDDGGLRRASSPVCWRATVDGVAYFDHDDHDDRGDAVAAVGALAVEVGLAFLGWIAPQREPAALPLTSRTGAIAAIYLGLGVPVVSSRHRLEAAGRAGASADDPALTLAEGVELLAIQAVLRGREDPAIATLSAPTLRAVRQAIDSLTVEREALCAGLSLDPGAPRPRLERDPAPAFARSAEARPWDGAQRVRWDEVGRFEFEGRDGTLYAIWPEPCLPDRVLARAGLAVELSRRRDGTDQSAPILDLYDLVDDALRLPAGLASWDGPSSTATSVGDGVLWLWLANPCQQPWSQVHGDLPRPRGAPPEARSPAAWQRDDVEHAVDQLESLDARYAWVADRATIVVGERILLHPIGPPDTDVILERVVVDLDTEGGELAVEPGVAPGRWQRTLRVRGRCLVWVRDDRGRRERWDVVDPYPT